ncbi:smc4 (nucleomorph) [Hemiselmis andersenii]|uniref:Structural maintenance of chromosomes protein n=4 Tax=Hemiselmis andersenii TaxID=464988 RepID=A9BLD4_HEMAN|nr:smc4 [Hemiselmis andersenii]ABW98317.1 smc4 [Hemiselmis andersenii]
MENKIFLKSIRFTNFKSYKGIQEAGPCHPKINTIIGPNGSGKSNFLDAILFVLGKRAVQIRFKKLSDLINLSASPFNKFTTVSLIFRKNLKRIFEKKLISTEIILSRQIFLNNSSTYYLNGKEVSLYIMTQSLRIAGILNKNDRFLIQQGEIERISTMKPKNEGLNEIGLLEYSEDSFGSSRYLKTINKKKKKISKIIMNLKIKKEFFKKKNFRKIFFPVVIKNSQNHFKKKFSVLNFLLVLNSIRKMEAVCWKIKNQEREIKIKNFWSTFTSRFLNFEKDKRKCKKIFKNCQFKALKTKKLSIFLEKWFSSLKEKDFLLKQEWEFVSKKKIFKFYSKNKIFPDFWTFRHKNFKFFLELENLRKKERKFFLFRKKEKILFLNFLFSNQFQITFCKGFHENFFGNFKIIFSQKNWKKNFFQKRKLKVFFLQKKNFFFFKKCGFKKFFLNKQTENSNIFWNTKFLKKKIFKFFYPKVRKKITKVIESIRKLIFLKDFFTFCSKKVNLFFFLKLKKTENFFQLHFNLKKEILKKKLQKRLETLKKLNFFSMQELNRFFFQTKTFFSQNLSLIFRNMFPIEINKKFHMLKKNIPGILDFIGSLGYVKILNLVAFYTIFSGYLSTILIDNSLNCFFATNFLKKNKIGRTNFLVYEKIQNSYWSKNFEREKPKNYLANLIYCKPENQLIFDFILKDTVFVKNLSEGLFYSSRNKYQSIVTQDGKVIEISGILSGGGISNNIFSFLFGNRKKKMNWINKFEFLKLLSENYKKIHDFSIKNISTFKKEDRSFYKKTKKKIFFSFFLFLKLVFNNKKINPNFKVEKKTVKNFQKKVMLLETKKYISRAFFRTIDLNFGKKIFLNFFKKKKTNKKKRPINLFKKINEKVQHHLTTINILEKKIYVLGLVGNSVQYKHKGKHLKKKFKILKFFQNFYKLFLFFLLEKYIFLEGLKKINEKQCLLEKYIFKKKKFFYDRTKNNFFTFKIRVKFEIKKTFLFWKRLKKFCFFEVFNKNSFLLKRNSEPILKKKYRTKSFSFWLFQKKKPTSFFFFINSFEFFSNSDSNSFFNLLKKFKEFLINQSKNGFRKKLFFKKIFIENICFSYHLQRLSEYIQYLFIFDLFLKIIFPLISKRGTMEINLVETMDPFLEGVVLSVKPPEKTWKTVSYLSGGEKTLSSLAVVFSLQELKYSSWYLLDEIDAALDFRNVTKISSYLISYAKNSQILIVSLRNNILANSNQILGIYKIFGETKIISLQNRI